MSFIVPILYIGTKESHTFDDFIGLLRHADNWIPRENLVINFHNTFAAKTPAKKPNRCDSHDT